MRENWIWPSVPPCFTEGIQSWQSDKLGFGERQGLTTFFQEPEINTNHSPSGVGSSSEVTHCVFSFPSLRIADVCTPLLGLYETQIRVH